MIRLITATALLMGLTGCDRPPAPKDPTVYRQVPKDGPRGVPSMSVGPKLTVGPSYNLIKGRYEFFPSLGLGPRLDFF